MNDNILQLIPDRSASNRKESQSKNTTKEPGSVAILMKCWIHVHSVACMSIIIHSPYGLDENVRLVLVKLQAHRM
jgi:hypothetical protein